MNVLNSTASICNICLRRSYAETFEEENRIYIRTVCPEHGEFVAPHVWDDPQTYRFLMRFDKFRFPSRKVLLNVTNQCNLNCSFCYAHANGIDLEELRLEDIKKIDLSCFEYVYLSGGEPTIKDDILDIIRYLKQGGKKVVLLTNGVKLVDLDFVKALKACGVDLVFLQFDSLDKEEVVHIRGIDLLSTKLKVVENLQKAALPVYFFSIILKHNSATTIASLLEYFIKHKGVIKGINLNTLWKIGRYNDREWISTEGIIREACRIMNVEKQDVLLSTEFTYYFFILIATLRDRRRYFSRCMLFLLVIFDQDKVVPVTKIFNVERLTAYLKEIVVKKRRSQYVSLTAYVFCSQILVNFLVNRYFRLFVLECFRRLRHIFSPNSFLLNPFTTFNIGEFPTAEDLDYDFVDTCNLVCYSRKDRSSQPVCINQIKFARSNHPLYGQ